jgi:hypothetical protein
MSSRLALIVTCCASISAATPPVPDLCRPAAQYGAQVGIDNRGAFQRALNAGCLDLRGAPGRYGVAIPPYPRAFATLTMPPATLVIGDGAETIAYIGDPMGHDWRGIQPTGAWSISRVTLAVEEPSGTWDEQSHVIEVIGPLAGGELSYVTISHPSVAGSRRGDCMRILGRPNQRVWDQHIHHVTFQSCARSSIAIYAGLHGRLLPPDSAGEVHSSTRIDHTISLDTYGQDIDMEGGGDPIGGLDASDIVEIDHNTYMAGPHRNSAIAISVYPGTTHFHHNIVNGRGLDFLGGSHEVDHNEVTLVIPNGGDPMVYVRKAGSSSFHDETWTRAATAGPGPVFAAAQKITGPTNVSLTDVAIQQHTAAGPIVVSGVIGVRLRGVRVTDDGPPTAKPGFRDAVRIEGTNGIVTTGVTISDSSFSGQTRAAISVSGSYKGVGTLEVTNDTSTGATQGLRCENTVASATLGGISGPITYSGNTMPAPLCAPFAL